MDIILALVTGVNVGICAVELIKDCKPPLVNILGALACAIALLVRLGGA